jgi:hypothetical protein
MKKALISPNESVIHYDGSTVLGHRIAEVHDTGFDVALPLHWIDCADDLVVDTHYYDAGDSTIKAKPVKSAEELAAELAAATAAAEAAAAIAAAEAEAARIAAAEKLVADYEAAKALLAARANTSPTPA